MLSNFNKLFHPGRIIKGMAFIAIPDIIFVICFFTNGIFWQYQRGLSVGAWTLVTDIAPFSWGEIGGWIWAIFLGWSIIGVFLFAITSIILMITCFLSKDDVSLKRALLYFFAWVGILAVYWATTFGPVGNWMSWPLD